MGPAGTPVGSAGLAIPGGLPGGAPGLQKGAIPTLSEPLLLSAPGADLALALPVSRALAPESLTHSAAAVANRSLPELKTAPLSAPRVTTSGTILPRTPASIARPSAAPGALSAPSPTRKAPLLNALRLPSLLQGGIPYDAADAKRLAAEDFLIHIGGRGVSSEQAAAGPNAAVSGLGSGSVSGAPTGASGFIARTAALPASMARAFSALPAALSKGLLVLQNPDGAPSVLEIRHADGSAVKPTVRRAVEAAANGVAHADRAALNSASPLRAPVSNGVKAASGDRVPSPAPRPSFFNRFRFHPLGEFLYKEGGARQFRSAYFPLVLVAVSAAALALAWGIPAAVSAVSQFFFEQAVVQGVGAAPAVSIFQQIFSTAFFAALAATGIAAALAVWELTQFKLTVASGRSVSDEEFWRFARKELSGWNLHPSVLASLLGTGPGHGIIRIYRPSNKYRHLAFAFSQAGMVYIRPELALSPRMFRWVVKHELRHYRAHQHRGPPLRQNIFTRAAAFVLSEFGARLAELRPISSLHSVQIPVLQRVLEEARVSLKLKHNYDALIIHPGSHETRDPGTFDRLSGGAARVIRLKTSPSDGKSAERFTTFGDPLLPMGALGTDGRSPREKVDYAPEAEGIIDYLGRPENKDRFRVVVYPQSFGVVPGESTPERRRLTETLHKLDEIHFMKQRLEAAGSQGFQEGTEDARKLDALSTGILGRLVSRKGSAGKVDNMLEQMMLQVVRSGLKGLEIAEVLESLYRATRDKGVVLLPFAPGEPSLDTVQRVLRYWQAADGGEFAIERVDLPEGGHVLVARKMEPRVDLWLDAKDGGTIEKSFTRVFNRPRGEQEAYLSAAGFTDEEIGKFREAGMVVKHVFGKEHGEKIFVSVHRRHAKALKQYGDEAGINFAVSRGGFTLHLMHSAGIQKVDKIHTLGLKGAGGKIYDIDTGLDVTHPDFADRELKSVDFVDEGWEDWIGHGTHKAGISYAGGALYLGMAPQAEGRMGKVFAQNGFGANDGDIMAAAVDAMQWGADVISLSLGSKGSVDSPLAKFFSELTLQKNANGEYPIVTGSAGNSGPFNETKSQPSVGERVASISAAAKSLDDGVPEISFYSSVGPTVDKRWSRKRLRRPLGVTALGGDVTTPPGVTDVYEHGIEAPKSKDMAAGPSDSKDGKGTRMSGTSMSNPQVAGLALLVKQGVQKVLQEGSEAAKFFSENLPFAVNLIMMRSAVDMRVPIFFQEGGFIDGLGALELGAKTFGGSLTSLPRKTARAVLRLFGAAPPVEKDSEDSAPSWDWIRRIKMIWELEDGIFQSAEAAKVEALNVLEAASVHERPDAPSEDPMVEASEKRRSGDEANGVYMKVFKKSRTEAREQLTSMLSDKVWLVRMYAAFAFLNLKDPAAAEDLMETALNDPDGRVRQTAFFALAELSSYQIDEALKQALSNGKADVRMYAAYALARHGDASGVDRIIAEARSEDKKDRYTAVWLLGQLGRRAPPEAADALSGRVNDARERGNVQHIAVASLTEIAMLKPDAVTNQTIAHLLDASGPQNFALTRTISKFFSAVARSAEVRERMQQEPLHEHIITFIHKHKASVNRPGALGQMVQLLAKIVNVSLEMPTPIPDPNGTAVPGVDGDLGEVHLIVELPANGTARIEAFQDFRGQEGSAMLPQTVSSFGLEAETLSRHNARVQTAMPVSQTLWVQMPAPKVMAFKTELEMRGYTVRRAAPMYRLTHDTKNLGGMPAVRKKGLTGKGVLVVYLDEGGDPDHPAITPERVAAKRNFIVGEGGPEDVESEGVSHGTHGMGIVGGSSVEGSPYEGMAPGVKFAIGKVLGQTGGSEATVMAGLEWAASLVKDPLKTPVIVNLSLGGPGRPDNALGRLVNKLRLMNIGVVVAAGNSGPAPGTVSSPANAELAISIGAVDKKGVLAEYSSRGHPGDREISWLDFGGGVFFDRPNPYEIISALNTRLAEASKGAATAVEWLGKTLYHYMSGTSMAAPHSTGKLADLVEHMRDAMETLPNGYLFWIEDIVARTASRMDGDESAVGAGVIDMDKALAEMDQALKNPEQVRAESQSLYERAAKQAGLLDEPPAPKPEGWFTRNTKLALHSFMWAPLAVGGAVSIFQSKNEPE